MDRIYNIYIYRFTFINRKVSRVSTHTRIHYVYAYRAIQIGMHPSRVTRRSRRARRLALHSDLLQRRDATGARKLFAEITVAKTIVPRIDRVQMNSRVARAPRPDVPSSIACAKYIRRAHWKRSRDVDVL